MLSVVDEIACAKSRIVGLRMTFLTLRLMENWQHAFDDSETAAILLAIAAINGEKLLRAELEPQLQDLRNPMPLNRLTKCNINSIAQATRINRETTRRKVNAFIESGIVVRNADGSVNLRPGFTQGHQTIRIVRTQLETFNRVANELLRDGVLKTHAVG